MHSTHTQKAESNENALIGCESTLLSLSISQLYFLMQLKSKINIVIITIHISTIGSKTILRSSKASISKSQEGFQSEAQTLALFGTGK